MPIRPAIASVSLGRASAGHKLPEKIQQAAKYGFEGIEIFYECLEYHAKDLTGGTSNVNLIEAARDIRRMCDDASLVVIVLQPFGYYEGLMDPTSHQKMIDKATTWFEMAHILGTDLMQIPTNFLEEGTTGDVERVTADMIEIADLGLKETPVIRFAYEGVAWGNHIDTWDGTYDIVRKVDRPNFGLCLDSFHIAGRVHGDPTVASGANPHAERDMKASLEKMIEQLDVKKIFYFQVGDAQLLNPPLSELHPMWARNQKPRMTWARNARLFPFEEDKGAYLPIMDVMDAVIVKLGYDSWVSMEIFNIDLFSENKQIPGQYAERGQVSWRTLQKKLGLEEHVKN
jgi:4-hydroxyphenylpyruvate dioxygenase